jgi:hypothetical protein
MLNYYLLDLSHLKRHKCHMAVQYSPDCRIDRSASWTWMCWDNSPREPSVDWYTGRRLYTFAQCPDRFHLFFLDLIQTVLLSKLFDKRLKNMLHWFRSAKLTGLEPQKTCWNSSHWLVSALNSCFSPQFILLSLPLLHMKYAAQFELSGMK